MKKSITGAIILVFALLRAGAATWEGSAIAGGAGDFPAEGLYAACNSFPRDSVIELSNLENGRTVTVTIISNVDNPGVFIALSPKTAEALGMKPGAAVRVRAVSLAASPAEATLPAARAGISADPDFNPRVFFEREKAALAAAAGEAPSVAAATPAAPTPAAPTPAAVQPEPATPLAQPETPAVAIATPAAPAPTTPVAPSVETLRSPAAAARTSAVAAVQEPPAPVIATTTPQEEQRADVIALATGRAVEAQTSAPSLSEPGEPRLAAAAAQAQPQIPEQPPVTDTATITALARPTDTSEPLALDSLAEPFAPEKQAGEGPETVLSRIASPASLPELPLLTDAEPFVREPSAEQESMEALVLARPAGTVAGQGAEFGELAEAEMPGLPDAVYLGKPAAPGSMSAVELADAEAPAPADAIGTGRPVPPAAAQAADAELGEPVAPKQPAQTGVVAIGGTKPKVAEKSESALAEPGIPEPSESLVASKPAMASSTIALADEPSIRSPVETGSAPTAISSERPEALPASTAVAALAEPSPAAESATGAFVAAKPSMASPAEAALANPDAPVPTESLSAGPSAPPSKGDAVVALEPALPRPPEAAAPAAAAPTTTAPVMVPTAPSPPTSVATINGTGGKAEPPSSLPVIKGLNKGSYYIQIGVYGTNDALVAATVGLGSTYPVAVERISTKTGDSAYRLFIGPVARDESGLALLKIRSMGFKDAFVKQGS